VAEEQSAFARRVKRASQMLFFQRHRRPYAKGWELRRVLGKDYMKAIKLLDAELERIGLRVKIVFDQPEAEANPGEDQLERARFFVTLREPLTLSEANLAGWRVDDVAILAATLAFILSKEGKAARKEVVKLLREKFPDWRVETNLDRYVRRGYLGEDEAGMMFIDWRTRAEIDQKTLLSLILAETPQQESAE
jgi:hypothetical protein